MKYRKQSITKIIIMMQILINLLHEIKVNQNPRQGTIKVRELAYILIRTQLLMF